MARFSAVFIDAGIIARLCDFLCELIPPVIENGE